MICNKKQTNWPSSNEEILRGSEVRIRIVILQSKEKSHSSVPIENIAGGVLHLVWIVNHGPVRVEIGDEGEEERKKEGVVDSIILGMSGRKKRK